MKKQLVKKTILSLIIFTLISPQIILPFHVEAEAKVNWENPSAKGNPYKIQLTDALNSRLLVDVVGCTGLVENVSKAVTGFAQDQLKILQQKAYMRAKIRACESGKKGAVSAVAAAMNLSLTDIPLTIDCKPDPLYQPVVDTEAISANAKEQKKTREEERRKDCLNGIAYTLAKEQLATMTQYTMNWVNTGFSGDPFYVRNIDSFLGNMTNDIMMKELNMFKGQPQYYPYGNDFYRGTILGEIARGNFKESMKQSLSNYLGYGGLGYDTVNVVERYTNNFGEGGWNGWLAFTQYPENNYLGYTMETTENIARLQNQQIENTKAELVQNNGFFSQKKCVEFGVTIKNTIGANGKTTMETVVDKNKCVKWETITPGSVIGSKINTYINSPERQLELADTINESLSVLFSSLINTLQNNGLSSLTSYNLNAGNIGGGSGYNSSLIQFDPETNEVLTSSSYTNNSVDLTRDLGNTYIHEGLKNKGSWDAKNNVPKLYTGIGETNSYYTVSNPGNTPIIKNGYNGWAKGDRAFFNGEEWQNWKQGELSPIKNRGIVQIQQDYLVVAKELLAVLPGVMPKLGELDYCIPGPNPGWESNAGEASDAFVEYVDGLNTDYTPPGGFLGNREYVEITSPDSTSQIVKTYQNIFTGTNLWNKVSNSYPYKSIWTLDDLREDPKSVGWKGTTGTGESRVEEAIGMVTDLKDKILQDLELFKTKYSIAINNIYGSGLMLKEFYEEENTYTMTPNSGYLEMAKSGLNITKDMVSYNEKITEAEDSYKNDEIEANTNIKKLNLIKNRVSAIITEAQKRRNVNRDRIIAEYNKTNNTNITRAEYDKCAKEESVSFYEDVQILNGENAGAEKERCADGIDNDLDGFVDNADNNCPDYIYTPPTQYDNTTSNNRGTNVNIGGFSW